MSAKLLNVESVVEKDDGKKEFKNREKERDWENHD
jgi:hypothetical protein